MNISLIRSLFEQHFYILYSVTKKLDVKERQ